MIVEHSGWSQERGYFCDKYEIDTTRTDHEIRWKNGKVCKQQGFGLEQPGHPLWRNGLPL